MIPDGEKPTLKDKENLPYTEATITEVLRVCPTAPSSLPHQAIRDTEMGGYKIPKGTEVSLVYTTWTLNCEKTHISA